MLNVIFESHALYEIMWKNMAEPERPQMTIRRLPIACWITKATDTRSEYVVLTAFPLQQRCYVYSMYVASLIGMSWGVPSLTGDFRH
jgi:hypothetical protein